MMKDAHLTLGNRSEFGLICPSRNGTNTQNEDSERCVGAKLDRIKAWERVESTGESGFICFVLGSTVSTFSGRTKLKNLHFPPKANHCFPNFLNDRTFKLSLGGTGL